METTWAPKAFLATAAVLAVAAIDLLPGSLAWSDGALLLAGALPVAAFAILGMRPRRGFAI